MIGDPTQLASRLGSPAVVVPRAQLATVTARLELVAAKEAEMPAKVAAGGIRSVLEHYP